MHELHDNDRNLLPESALAVEKAVLSRFFHLQCGDNVVTSV
jgi:hypothetical protein